MNKIKALVFDVDGTLIPFGDIILTEKMTSVLNELSKEYKIIIATGRHISEVSVLDKLNVDAYVTSDGQAVKMKDGTLYQTYVDQDDLKILYEYMKEDKVAAAYQTLDGYHANKVTERTHEYHRYVHLPSPTVKPLSYFEDAKALTVTVYAAYELVEEIASHMKNTQAIFWNPFGGDLVNLEAGKALGLGQALKHLNIDPSEALCFGDGNNDVCMFELCGNSCAMKKSHIPLKDVATYVTDQDDNDGIYDGLYHFGIGDYR